MRILFVADSIDPTIGGAELSTRDLISGLSGPLDEIDLLTTEPSISEFGRLAKSGKVVLLPFSERRFFKYYRSLFNYKFIWALFKITTQYRYDIIVFGNISHQVSYACILIAKIKKIRCIHILRDAMPLFGGKQVTLRYRLWDEIRRHGFSFNPFRRCLSIFCLQLVDANIAISKFIEKTYVTSGVNVKRVIYNGVDSKIVTSNANFHDEQPIGTLKILWPARLSKLKGSEIVSEVVSQLGELDIRFLIAGHKPSDLNMATCSNINFLGWLSQEDLEKSYRNCDVVIYPSQYLEPLGRVPIEAMSYSKPVIATKLGGLTESICHNRSGFLVSNTDDLVMAILTYYNNRQLLEEHGSEGLRLFEEKFSKEMMIDRYREVVREVSGL